ncbi:MAG: ABC transporter permease [Dehalococcoidales bacterium]|nr:ABC transporter permease [Dehalococcoidales bacterium]
MITFIIRRLLLSIIVLVIVSALVFVAMRILPGDPIFMLLTQSQQTEITQEQIDLLRQEYGLDKSLAVQYLNWLGGMVRGDLGMSILTNLPVADEILRRLPITLNIGLPAFLLGIVLGIPAGVLCAVRRGTFIDTLVTTFSNIGITIPVFWLGFILIYLFSIKLGWLPALGYTSPLDDLVLNIKQIILPIICLAVFPISATSRQTRSSVLDVMKQDYIRTAWSKGLRERVIIAKHALKNSLIPVVTLSGMGLSMIIGGSVIVETVFNIPGMGRLAVQSVFSQDYPYVQGIVLFVAIVVLLANLLTDIAYGYLDPRIRYG